VDPIAVPVRDGFLIRVGARNSGPRSITAPAGQSAASLRLVFTMCCLHKSLVRSLGGCEIGYWYPPSWPTTPEEPHYYDCSSHKRTLKVNETYWESFVFTYFPSDSKNVSVDVAGYAQDTNESDNSRNLVVRVGQPGSSLPVTGPRTVSIVGAGFALVIAGALAIWYGRRRRLIRPTR
jgi:hypothetical protein